MAVLQTTEVAALRLHLFLLLLTGSKSYELCTRASSGRDPPAKSSVRFRASVCCF